MTSNENAVARAYNRLKHEILTAQLPPHAQFLETELAKRMQISRTPVREACVRLEAEGLVEIVPRRGIRIVPISAQDMSELYDLLATLEARAAELAAGRDLPAAELEALFAAVDRMDAALAVEDLDEWADADSDFHRLLVHASGNRHLANTALGYTDRIHRARSATLRLRSTPTDSVRDHRELVEAIERGEGAAARELHLQHRRETAETLTRLLIDHGLSSL